MTSRTVPLLGSGYRPTIWCTNPACHAPVPADALACPECKEPVVQPQVALHEPQAAEIDVETLLREGRY